MIKNDDLDLKSFINQLHSVNSIKRKLDLFPIMEYIKNRSYASENIYKGIGEDSAAIFVPRSNTEDLILITTDSINESFCKKSPWSAGFSSILVCLEDINACGGTPLAASINISTNSKEIHKQLLDGILSASQKFQIPIVRGHTSDETSNISISVTIIGTIKKKDYISAGNANENDDLLLVYDPEGKPAKSNRLYWDTVTFKTTQQILYKRKFMQNLAKVHLVNASKDVSNGGLFGTLLLMLKYSNKGGHIFIENIKIPEALQKLNYSLLDFVIMYLTTSFILTCNEKNTQKIMSLAKKHELKCFKIGKITKQKNVVLWYKQQSQIAWKIS
ncbi:MAG: AIR synthase related protein [Promethearchaeota archaeon]